MKSIEIKFFLNIKQFLICLLFPRKKTMINSYRDSSVFAIVQDRPLFYSQFQYDRNVER